MIEKHNFYYSCKITIKSVTSWRLGGAHLSVLRWGETQVFFWKFCVNGEPLATLCRIWEDLELNHWPSIPEANRLPRDQLVGDKSKVYWIYLKATSTSWNFVGWNWLNRFLHFYRKIFAFTQILTDLLVI